jgi:hypothetical protein
LAGHSTARFGKLVSLAGACAGIVVALTATAVAKPSGAGVKSNIPLPVLAPWHKPRTPSTKPRDNSKQEQPGKPAPVEPPPDVWSDGEVADGLKVCVQKLAHIQARVEIADPFKKGPCGAPASVEVRLVGTQHPLKVSPPATLRCKMAVSLYWFIEKSLQPAAIAILGSPVKSFRGISSYSCRNRNGAKKGKLSEHALANALDVGVFKLANGKTISVLRDWGPTKRDLEAPAGDDAKPKLVAITGKQASARPARRIAGERKTAPIPVKKSDAIKGRTRGRAKTQLKSKPTPAAKPKRAKVVKPAPPTKASLFLKRIHKEACQYFGTVLGPEANEAHRDHFHFDMAPRRRSNYCR